MTTQRHIIFTVILFASILFIVAIAYVLTWDSKRIRHYEKEAIPVGLAKAKQECQNEGLKTEICKNMTGSAVSSECEGRPCWVVQVASKDPHDFLASVTVVNSNNQYIVQDYQRGRLTSP